MTRERIEARLDYLADQGISDAPEQTDWAHFRYCLDELIGDRPSDNGIMLGERLHTLINTLEYRELQNELEPF